MGSSKKRIVAFIPARGGSTSIPLKNIKLLAGKPLIYWTLRACSDSNIVDEIVVATDSDVIKQCVLDLALPKVRVVSRSAQNATATASTESVMLEFAAENVCDHIMLVQATSPLLTVGDVNNAFSRYFDSKADSLLSVVRTKRFIWKQSGEFALPDNYDPSRRPRRQDWDGQLVENGALYITSRQRLLETKVRISGNIASYEMPEETYFELDEPSDWAIVEKLLQNRIASQSPIASLCLKAIFVDVDGTLTDGGMYYTEEGEVMKRFNTKDAAGMSLLAKQGLIIGMISKENSSIVLARARKLGLEHVYIGIADKEKFMNELLRKIGLSWDELAYVGDDLNDLPVLKRAGFAACPCDAATEIRQNVKYVCKKIGRIRCCSRGMRHPYGPFLTGTLI